MAKKNALAEAILAEDRADVNNSKNVKPQTLDYGGRATATSKKNALAEAILAEDKPTRKLPQHYRRRTVETPREDIELTTDKARDYDKLPPIFYNKLSEKAKLERYWRLGETEEEKKERGTQLQEKRKRKREEYVNPSPYDGITMPKRREVELRDGRTVELTEKEANTPYEAWVRQNEKKPKGITYAELPEIANKYSERLARGYIKDHPEMANDYLRIEQELSQVVYDKMYREAMEKDREFFSDAYYAATGVTPEERIEEIKNIINELKAEEISDRQALHNSTLSGQIGKYTGLSVLTDPITESFASEKYDDVLEMIEMWEENDFTSAISSSFDLIDALTFGIAGWADSADINTALEKVENGEKLNKFEERSYRLWQLTEELKSFKDKVYNPQSGSSKIGEGVGSSLAAAPMFAVDMFATGGIGSFAKLGGKQALKQALKSGGADLLKYGATTTGKVVHNFGVAKLRGLSAALVNPSTYNQYYEALNSGYSFDENNQLVYKPVNKGQAYFGALMSSANEVSSEYIGIGIGEVVSWGGKQLGRVLAHTPIGNIGKKLPKISPQAATFMRTVGVQPNYVAEVFSEAAGDLMTTYEQSLLGLEVDYNQYSDADYWITLMGVSLAYGGSIAMVGGTISAVQVKNANEIRQHILEEIGNRELRNTLSAIAIGEDVTLKSASLADMNWESFDEDDKRNARAFIIADLNMKILQGYVEENERLKKFQGTMENMRGIIYQPEAGEYTDVIVEAETENGEVVYVINGLEENNTTDLLTVVDPSTGKKVAVAKDKITEQRRLTADEYIQDAYIAEFSTEAEVKRVNDIKGEASQMDNPSERDVARVASMLNITLPKVGATVMLSNGNMGVVSEVLSPAEYAIQLADGTTYKVHFTELLSSDSLTAKAQTAIAMGETSASAQEVINTPAPATETISDVNTGATLAGQQVTIDGREGVIKGMTDDGSMYAVSFQTDGEADVEFFTKEEIEAQLQTEKAEQTASAENVDNVEVVTETTAEVETPQAEPTVTQVATTEDGEVDIEQLSAEDAAKKLVTDLGDAQTAIAEVEAVVETLNNEREKERSKKPTSLSDISKKRKASKALDARIEHYNNVLNSLRNIGGETSSQQDFPIGAKVVVNDSTGTVVDFDPSHNVYGVTKETNDGPVTMYYKADKLQKAPIDNADATNTYTEVNTKSSSAPSAETKSKGNNEPEPIGLIRNETALKFTDKILNPVDTIAKRLGVTVEFVDDLTDVNGQRVNGDIVGKKIRLSATSKKGIRFIVGHEFFHRIKDLVTTEQYAQFVGSIKEFMGEERWAKALEYRRWVYRNHNARILAESLKGKPIEHLIKVAESLGIEVGDVDAKTIEQLIINSAVDKVVTNPNKGITITAETPSMPSPYLPSLVRLTEELCEEETVADFVGEMVNNTSVFTNYAESISDKIWLLRVLRKAIRGLKGLLKSMDSTTEQKKLNAMENALTQLLAEAETSEAKSQEIERVEGKKSDAVTPDRGRRSLIGEQGARRSIIAPTFYSNAQYAVQNIKQDKATPEQWLKMIEKAGGLKAGEDKWLGLSDWLKASDKKTLTKDEVLQYIAENDIRIEEVSYGEPEYISENEIYESDAFSTLVSSLTDYDEDDNPHINQERYKELQNADPDFLDGFSLDYWGEGLDIDDKMAAARYLGLLGVDNEINNTRLQYTTQGLTKKKEIALVVPTIEPYNQSDEIHFGDAGEGRAVAWIRFGDAETPKSIPMHQRVDAFDAPFKNVAGYDVYAPEGRGGKFSKDYVIYGKLKDGSEAYIAYIGTKPISKHETLDEARNAMNEYYEANPRMITRYERVLVIDEIQSKRHQDGREKGYSDKRVSQQELYDAQEAAFEAVMEQERALADKYGEDEWASLASVEEMAEYERLRALDEAATNAYENYDKGVPSAPFEKNWAELAFKRMLRYAAENGYDYVAWTTGDQQADRYDIGSVVKDIVTYDTKDADGNPIKKMKFRMKNMGTYNIATNMEGVIVKGDGEMKEGMHLSDITGKPLAEYIMNGWGEDAMVFENGKDIEAKSLEGEGLHIGNEGMKAFYDQMLPSFVKKYTKKWGAEVKDITMPDLEENNTMHAVNVTDSMRESVMQGQPRFSLQTINDLRDALIEYNATSDIMSFVDAVREANNKFGKHPYITNLIMDYEEDNDADAFAEKIKGVIGEANEDYAPYTAGGVRYSLQSDVASILEEYDTEGVKYVSMRDVADGIEALIVESTEDTTELENILDDFRAAQADANKWGHRMDSGGEKEFEEALRMYANKATLEERSGADSHNSSSEGLPLESSERLSGNALASPKDVAKIGKNTEVTHRAAKNIINEGGLKKEIKTPAQAVSALGKGLHMEKSDSSQSYYGDFFEGDYIVDEKVVHIRISTHPATPTLMGNAEADHKVSIVIRKNGEHKSDGTPHNGYTEYTYDPSVIAPKDAANAVIKGVKTLLETGEYVDETKKAVRKDYPYIENGETKYSLITPEMDASYLDAVERGDMATAQRMVMEAAKLAMPNTKVVDEDGNPKVVYHGTPNNFNAFSKEMFGTSTDRGIWGNGFYFSDSEQYAKTYEKRGDKQGRTLTVFLNIENPLFISLRNGGNEGAMYFHELMEKHFTDDIYEDATRTDELMSVAQERLTADIMANGYDGIVVEYTNHIDTEYVAFNPNQIKSADPVTYDDAGNVIPLSVRFNPEKEDIRYSMSEETTQIFDAAKAKFGTTYDMREAGYILPDGSMLDFSGRHQVEGDASFLNGDRTVDHRDISDIAYDADDNETGIKTDLGDFLDRGAIRIDSNAGAINLNVAPTRAQKDRLKRLIERNEGYVYVDFGKGWDTEHYAEYEAVRASRVLGDIDRYFDEGIKPTGNVRFSLQDVETHRFNRKVEFVKTLVRNYNIPTPLFIAETKEEFVQMVKDYDGDVDEYTADTYGYYCQLDDIILLNGGMLITSGDARRSLIHEYAHSITKKYLGERLAEITSSLPKEDIDQARIELLKGRYKDVTPQDVMEEFVSYLVESLKNTEIDIIFENASTIDTFIEELRNKIDNLEELTKKNVLYTVLPLVKENLILQKEQYDRERKESPIVIPRVRSIGILRGDQEGKTILWNNKKSRPSEAESRVYEAGRGGEGTQKEEVAPRYQLPDPDPSEAFYDELPVFDENGNMVDITTLPSGVAQDILDSKVRQMLEAEYDHNTQVIRREAQQSRDAINARYREEKIKRRDGHNAARTNAAKIDEIFGDKPFESLPYEVQALILIATGQAKIYWGDRGSNRGLASELGLKGSTGDRHAYRNIWGGAKKSFNEVVHDWWESIGGQESGIDDNDLRNALISALQSVQSSKDALQELINNYDDLTIDRDRNLADVDHYEAQELRKAKDAYEKYSAAFELSQGEERKSYHDRAAQFFGNQSLSRVEGILEELTNDIERQKRKIERLKAEKKDMYTPLAEGIAKSKEIILHALERVRMFAGMEEVDLNDVARLINLVKSARSQRQVDNLNAQAQALVQRVSIKKAKANLARLLSLKLSNTDIIHKMLKENDAWTKEEREAILKHLWKVSRNGLRISKAVHRDTKEIFEELSRLVKEFKKEAKDFKGNDLVSKINKKIEAVEKSLHPNVSYDDQGNVVDNSNLPVDFNAENKHLAKFYFKSYLQMLSTEAAYRNASSALREKIESKEDTKAADADVVSTRQSYLNALTELNSSLETLILEGKDKLRDWNAEKERHEIEIRKMGIDAIGGRKASAQGKKSDWLTRQRARYNTTVNAPYWTFETVLLAIDHNSPYKKGKLYTYFMNKWSDANDNLISRYATHFEEMGEVMRAYFPNKAKNNPYKMYQNIMREAQSTPIGTLNYKEMGSDGQMRDAQIILNISNAMYIIAMWRQPRYREALENNYMLTQESINELMKRIAKENSGYIKMMNWVNNTFLPNTRLEYDIVYRKMNGGSMPKEVNYFPARVAAHTEIDLTNIDKGGLPTSPSALKDRVSANVVPLLYTDYFKVLESHIEDMDKWAAYAELTADLNVLLSSDEFRRRCNEYMGGLGGDGGGKGSLYEMFKQTSLISTGLYRGGDRIDLLGKVQKNWATSNIAFRYWTAVKQISSVTTGITEGWRIAKHLGITATGVGIYHEIKQAMEISPSLRYRWKSGAAGMEALMREAQRDGGFTTHRGVYEKGKDAVTDFVKSCVSFGMKPNAAIDLLACSVIVNTVYETEIARVTNGKREATAEEKREAVRKAERVFNTTQQSSEGAYLSVVQANPAYLMITTYMNASFALHRKRMAGLKELYKLATSSKYRRFLKDEFGVGAGLISAKDALKDIISSLAGEFGFTAMGWGLMEFMSALTDVGDDDDDIAAAKQEFIDTWWHSLLNGYLGGSIATSIMQGYDASLTPAYEELFSDIKGVFDGKGYWVSELVLLASKYGFGIDAKALYSIAAGLENMAKEERDEYAGSILLFLNAPTRYVKAFVGDRRDGETLEQYQTRIVCFYTLFEDVENNEYHDEEGKYIKDSAPSLIMSKKQAQDLRKEYEVAYTKSILLSQGDIEEYNSYVETAKKHARICEVLGFGTDTHPSNEKAEQSDLHWELAYYQDYVADIVKDIKDWVGSEEGYYDLLIEEQEAKNEFINAYYEYIKSSGLGAY